MKIKLTRQIWGLTHSLPCRKLNIATFCDNSTNLKKNGTYDKRQLRQDPIFMLTGKLNHFFSVAIQMSSPNPVSS